MTIDFATGEPNRKVNTFIILSLILEQVPASVPEKLGSSLIRSRHLLKNNSNSSATIWDSLDILLSFSDVYS